MDAGPSDSAFNQSNAPPLNPNTQMYDYRFGTNSSPGFTPPEAFRSDANNGWYQQDAEYEYDDDANGADGGEQRDAKRRRIARACDMCRKKKIKCDGKMPKCSHCENYKTECVFTQVEKKRAPPKGARYIEGLENRLGRMESLLRMSGLLAEDDGGKTDLGTLEKRLQERQMRRSESTSSPQTQSQTSRSADQTNMLSPHSSTPKEQQQTAQAQEQPPPKQSMSQQIQSPGNHENSSAPGQTSDDPGTSAKKEGKDVDVLADQMCSLITNNVGETRYIGSSSGFSIFSPKGIQWVNEKTGDTSFQQMIFSAAANDKQGWDHWRPEVFNDLFARRIFKPLPSRQECFALLKDFFANFNCMFPLFHEPTFMHLVDRHYSFDPYEGSGWWASLNVALAIAHRLRVMSNVVGQEEDGHAWGYLKNAMAVMTELTMRNTDLLSVQALIGMALFLQGTSNPQPSFFLVAAAIRLSHSIGLHKRGSGFNLNEVESEQRKRVFWIAYLLDKDICLRSGRPPAQDDDDMNVDLPSDDPPDNVGNIPLEKEVDGKRTMNLFRKMCMFAQIQSRVYKQLYSVKASRQSDGELLNTIGDLDAQLEEWKDGIPLDFRPENEIKAAHTPLILHVVVLHFAYYNCLTTIHRMSVHHGYWTSRLSDYAIMGLNARPLNPRVFMSAALCVNAARASIGLIRYIPQGDYACVWLILYYPVSALVTLFANILQNPQDARARSDLRLMSSVCSFLTMLERDAAEANGNVRRMLSVCSEFERIAKVVLDKAERELRGRSKRKQAERERKEQLADTSVVATGLNEGKTLEQMQVETQAAYRQPVQTASLRASIAGSQSGNAFVDSPAAGWDASPPGGNGPEYRQSKTPQTQNQHLSPPQQQQQPSQNHHFGLDIGQWGGPRSSTVVSSNPSPQPPFDVPNYTNKSPTPQQQQQQQSLPESNSNRVVAESSNFQHFPAPDPLAGIDLNTVVGDGNTASGFMGPSSNVSGLDSFQQPFVPQDLWQMPMTLEWDWAEGPGLMAYIPEMEPVYMGDGTTSATNPNSMQGQNQ